MCQGGVVGLGWVKGVCLAGMEPQRVMVRLRDGIHCWVPLCVVWRWVGKNALGPGDVQD